MDVPRWQFGLYKDGVLLETYKTDIDQFVQIQRAEGLRRADFLRQKDVKSTYVVEQIRTGCCIEEDGVVLATWRTSIDSLLPLIEIDASRELTALRQKNPNKEYVLIKI